MRRTSQVDVRTIPVPTPFPVGPVNVHLILAEPLTVIDTGPYTEEAWEALVTGLRQSGLAPRDVRRILLTHGHHDHFGLAGRLADVSGADIFGGKLDRPHFRMFRKPRPLLDQLTRAGFGFGARFTMIAAMAHVDRYGRPVDGWDALAGAEILPGDGYSIVVRSTPGHTPGSLTYEVPEAGVLFTGDTVLKDITPNAIVDEDPEKPGQPFRSVTRYFETLDRIGETSGGSRLLTGHGAEIPNFAAHRAKVDGRYRRRIAQMLAALRGRPMTIRELVLTIFPGMSSVNVFLAFSEVLGFVMYLEDLGKVEKVADGRLDRYRPVPD